MVDIRTNDWSEEVAPFWGQVRAIGRGDLGEGEDVTWGVTLTASLVRTAPLAVTASCLGHCRVGRHSQVIRQR